jgi:hypothetical protein
VEARAQALVAHDGMPRLRQPCAALSWRGGALNLIGVDDPRARLGAPSSRRRGLEARVRRDILHL